MSKIKKALDVVNGLKSLADSIETLAKEMEEPKNEDKPPTLEEVRKTLANLSQNGKQAEVKELISDFGAKKLSEIPAEKYSEVLEKASEL